MAKDTTARRPKDQHGSKTFSSVAGQLKKAGYTAASNRFRECVTHRKRLMDELRKVDPENRVLAEMIELDRKPA